VRRPSPVIAGVSAVALTVGAAALVLMWWFSVVTPWDETVVPLLVFGPVPLAVYALTAGSGLRPVARVATWVVVAVVMVGTVAVGASGSLMRARVGDTLAGMQADADRRLADVVVPSEVCAPPPAIDWGVLGPPREVCVVAYDIAVSQVGGVGRGVGEQAGPGEGDGPAGDGPAGDELAGEVLTVWQVRYDWDQPGSAPERMLVYEAAVAQPPADRCVRVVDDPWWAWRTDDGECPRGFVPSSG
jgi:hypothetical protein